MLGREFFVGSAKNKIEAGMKEVGEKRLFSKVTGKLYDFGDRVPHDVCRTSHSLCIGFLRLFPSVAKWYNMVHDPE